MKIICSGYQKTGTKSLAAALRLLGYNVYDFEEQYYYLGKEIDRILKEGWTIEELRRIYKDVDVLVDIPSCVIWHDLHKAFPEAQIIHTERSSEDAWANSLIQQFHSIQAEKLNRFFAFITPTGRLLTSLFNSALRMQNSSPASSGCWINESNKQLAILRYREHNAHVRTCAPKDQTLFFKVADGWESLCKFLDKPVPDIEFPHENRGAAVTKKVINQSLLFQQIRKEVITIFSAILLMSFLVGRYGLNLRAASAVQRIASLFSYLVQNVFRTKSD